MQSAKGLWYGKIWGNRVDWIGRWLDRAESRKVMYDVVLEGREEEEEEEEEKEEEEEEEEGEEEKG